MGVFEDVVVKAKAVAEVAGKKTGEFVELSKLKVNAAEVSKDISQRLEALGKIAYDAAKTENNADELIRAAPSVSRSMPSMRFSATNAGRKWQGTRAAALPLTIWMPARTSRIPTRKKRPAPAAKRKRKSRRRTRRRNKPRLFWVRTEETGALEGKLPFLSCPAGEGGRRFPEGGWKRVRQDASRAGGQRNAVFAWMGEPE